MTHLIDSALIQAFEDGSFSLPVASENFDYEPTAGTAYAQVFTVLNPSTILTLGDGGQDLFTGFFQVNLKYPLDQGAGVAKEKATDIQTAFKAGTRFTYSGQEVFITGAGRNGAGINVNGWYQITLTINFEARVTR